MNLRKNLKKINSVLKTYLTPDFQFHVFRRCSQTKSCHANLCSQSLQARDVGRGQECLGRQQTLVMDQPAQTHLDTDLSSSDSRLEQETREIPLFVEASKTRFADTLGNYTSDVIPQQDSA